LEGDIDERRQAELGHKKVKSRWETRQFLVGEWP
jgi:hypothetical protein